MCAAGCNLGTPFPATRLARFHNKGGKMWKVEPKKGNIYLQGRRELIYTLYGSWELQIFYVHIGKFLL